MSPIAHAQTNLAEVIKRSLFVNNIEGGGHHYLPALDDFLLIHIIFVARSLEERKFAQSTFNLNLF